MIKCIDHVGISVSDLERSLAFYGGVLGLELIDRETIADETIADLTGYDAVEMDCADLDSGDGRILELIQYRIPAAEPRRPELSAGGTLHLSLGVATSTPYSPRSGAARRVSSRDGRCSSRSPARPGTVCAAPTSPIRTAWCWSWCSGRR